MVSGNHRLPNQVRIRNKRTWWWWQQPYYFSLLFRMRHSHSLSLTWALLSVGHWKWLLALWYWTIMVVAIINVYVHSHLSFWSATILVAKTAPPSVSGWSLTDRPTNQPTDASSNSLLRRRQSICTAILCHDPHKLDNLPNRDEELCSYQSYYSDSVHNNKYSFSVVLPTLCSQPISTISYLGYFSPKYICMYAKQQHQTHAWWPTHTFRLSNYFIYTRFSHRIIMATYLVLKSASWALLASERLRAQCPESVRTC